MVEVPDDFVWPQPWRAIPLPSGHLGLLDSYEEELQRELCLGHPLFGVTCRVVGWNSDDPNEFLFETGNPKLPLAFVHLTFKQEHDPTWPFTIGYQDWEAFRIAWSSDE